MAAVGKADESANETRDEVEGLRGKAAPSDGLVGRAPPVPPTRRPHRFGLADLRVPRKPSAKPMVEGVGFEPT